MYCLKGYWTNIWWWANSTCQLIRDKGGKNNRAIQPPVLQKIPMSQVRYILQHRFQIQFACNWPLVLDNRIRGRTCIDEWPSFWHARREKGKKQSPSSCENKYKRFPHPHIPEKRNATLCFDSLSGHATNTELFASNVHHSIGTSASFFYILLRGAGLTRQQSKNRSIGSSFGTRSMIWLSHFGARICDLLKSPVGKLPIRPLPTLRTLVIALWTTLILDPWHILWHSVENQMNSSEWRFVFIWKYIRRTY